MSGAGTFLAIGECMVELSQAEGGLYRRGFAGDTFNTAWYARRLLPDGWRVAYGSCIGTDAISDEMAGFMEGAGVDTGTLARIPDRSVGLYMISTVAGERSFSYWRSQSAARCLADDGDRLDAMMDGAGIIHLSGITLAILTPAGRARLCDALGRARAGGAFVSFDTNLRPRLWEDEATMRAGLTMGAAAADLVLPSFDEETGLFGDAGPDETVARYREGGARMVVVKNGPDDVTLWSEETGRATLSTDRVEPVDTTAAGDSFAAATLVGIAQGHALEPSVREAMALAGRVIRHPGALVPEVFDDENERGGKGP